MRFISRRSVVVAGALAGALRPLAAQPRPRVVGVYSVSVEQQWVGRIHVALKAIAARGEIEYSFADNAGADYERVLRQYADTTPVLLVGECFAAEKAARKIARDHPEVAFLMGSGGKPQAPNFSVFDNYIQEAAFLSGMVAGGLTRSGKVGLVAGLPVPETNRLMNAFIAGVLDVRPRAETFVHFIHSPFDPPKSRQAAFELIDRGVDVLYAERFGVADAARERKVLAIGNVTHPQDKYPDTLVVSALWNVEPTLVAALRAVADGRFRAEDYGKYSGLKHKGSELSPLGSFQTKVPAELMVKVKKREQQILDGKFRVRIDDREPRGTRR